MGFLRASNYTRASAYMMTSATPKTSHPTVPKILRKAGELFQQAMALANGPVHRLQIPYQDGLHLPAYLHLPPLTRRLTGRIPLIINPGGADSIQEEIFYMFPAEGPELGYAVLTFDGPGQGPILHEHDVPMRPDWEVVSNAVFDFIVQYGSEHEDLELDFDRVAIAGASLGAYFALRSMDADPRYKVCIAIDPIYDLFDFATQHVSPRLLQYWSQGLVPDAVVDNIVWAGMQISFQTKWEIITSARFLGVSTPTDILRAMKPFTLKNRPGQLGIGRPECATFVSGAAGSLYLDFEAHTTKIFDQLASRDKELWVATTPGQGSLQAKMGAMAYCNQRAFAFLDQRFDMKRDF
jgi:pimeloyl-ACP methyl ester carboxylesterase